MNAHQLALQEARLALLQNFNPADLKDLWKLNYLYSLHFQGIEPPKSEDVSALIQSEPTAFWFASAVRVLDLWHEQTLMRQDVARSLASLLKNPFQEEDIAQAHQNAIYSCFKRSDTHPTFEDWMLNHMLYALTTTDIRRGYTELQEGADDASRSIRFRTFLEGSHT